MVLYKMVEFYEKKSKNRRRTTLFKSLSKDLKLIKQKEKKKLKSQNAEKLNNQKTERLSQKNNEKHIENNRKLKKSDSQTEIKPNLSKNNETRKSYKKSKELKSILKNNKVQENCYNFNSVLNNKTEQNIKNYKSKSQEKNIRTFNINNSVQNEKVSEKQQSFLKIKFPNLPKVLENPLNPNEISCKTSENFSQGPISSFHVTRMPKISNNFLNSETKNYENNSCQISSRKYKEKNRTFAKVNINDFTRNIDEMPIIFRSTYMKSKMIRNDLSENCEQNIELKCIGKNMNIKSQNIDKANTPPKFTKLKKTINEMMTSRHTPQLLERRIKRIKMTKSVIKIPTKSFELNSTLNLQNYKQNLKVPARPFLLTNHKNIINKPNSVSRTIFATNNLICPKGDQTYEQLTDMGKLLEIKPNETYLQWVSQQALAYLETFPNKKRLDYDDIEKYKKIVQNARELILQKIKYEDAIGTDKIFKDHSWIILSRSKLNGYFNLKTSEFSKKYPNGISDQTAYIVKLRKSQEENLQKSQNSFILSNEKIRSELKKSAIFNKTNFNFI